MHDASAAESLTAFVTSMGTVYADTRTRTQVQEAG